MRNKVLAVFETYAEGLSIRKSREQHGLRAADFYKTLHDNPDLATRYRFIQKSRADMCIDRAQEIADDCATVRDPFDVLLGTEKPAPDPRLARVAIDGLRGIGGVYDSERFGTKLAIEHDVKPNLVEAIQAGRSRAALPSRDLHPVIDVQAIDITPMLTSPATDMQSEAEEIDPFS